jgi:hypothetical protein
MAISTVIFSMTVVFLLPPVPFDNIQGFPEKDIGCCEF